MSRTSRKQQCVTTLTGASALLGAAGTRRRTGRVVPMQRRVRCKEEFESSAGLWELAPRLCSRPGREVLWRPVKMAVAELPLRAASNSGAGGGGGEPQPEPECTLLHTAGPSVRLRSVDQSRGGAWIDVITRADVFREQPTCLDLRPGTGNENDKGAGALAVIGIHSGEIVLLDPLQQRVLAIWNKGHLNAAGRCTDITWAPHDPLQFAASFASGVVLLFELGRPKEDKLSDGAHEPKSLKHNPRQRWVVCKDPVLALKYGPPDVANTAGLLAVGAGDGALRLFDTATGAPTLTFTSYFGAVRCIDWSADGKYILTGGEDDNVVIWSLEERRQIARCVGHSSWISSVRFLPWAASAAAQMDTQASLYTFASAGWDGRLCIWEVDTTVVGAGKQDAAAAATGGESGLVVAAVGERDRSVGRVVPIVDEISLHTKPLSALAVSADHLFTGQCARAASPHPGGEPGTVPYFARLLIPWYWVRCARVGCDANELKAWARPAIIEPPPITNDAGSEDDGLVDVESDTGSEEREDEEGPRAVAGDTHTRTEEVTADV